MRCWILFLSLCFTFCCYSQEDIKLKRRYFGQYKGEIPAYQAAFKSDIIDVSEAEISILLEKNQSITITIGNRTLNGTFIVLFKANNYYLLDATMEGQQAKERILVYKRGRKIAREGLFPQPLAELKRSRGK